MGRISGIFPQIQSIARSGLLIVHFQIFLYTSELADRGVHKLEKKNVVFTKDGAKVGVKEISAEKYADKTQRAFVNTWNAAQDR